MSEIVRDDLVPGQRIAGDSSWTPEQWASVAEMVQSQTSMPKVEGPGFGESFGQGLKQSYGGGLRFGGAIAESLGLKDPGSTQQEYQQQQQQYSDYQARKQAAWASQGRSGPYQSSSEWMGENLPVPLAVGTAMSPFYKQGMSLLKEALLNAGAGGLVELMRAGSTPGTVAAGAGMGALATPFSRPLARMVWGGQQIAKRAVPPPASEVNAALRIAFAENGIDWETLAKDMKEEFLSVARAQIQQTGDIDPEAVARLALIRRRVPGAEVTAGMATRDPLQWARERNAAQIINSPAAAEMQGIMRTNDKAFLGAADDLTRSVGTPSTKVAVSNRFSDYLQGKASQMQELISKEYKQIAEKYGDKFGATADNLVNALNADDEIFKAGPRGEFAKSIAQQLNRYGLVSFDDRGRPIIATTSGGQPALRVRETETLRQWINQKSNDPAVIDLQKKLRNALDADVEAGAPLRQEITAALGADPYKRARDLAKTRFTLLDRSENNLLWKLSQGSANEDVAVERIIGKGTTIADLQNMKRALWYRATDASGKTWKANEGRQIWDDMGATVLNDLFGGATGTGGGFNGSTFIKKWKLLKETGKADVLFKRPVVQAMDDLSRAAEALFVEPAHAPVARGSASMQGSIFYDLMTRLAGQAGGGLGKAASIASQMRNVVSNAQAENQTMRGLAQPAVSAAALDERKRQMLQFYAKNLSPYTASMAPGAFTEFVRWINDLAAGGDK